MLGILEADGLDQASPRTSSTLEAEEEEKALTPFRGDVHGRTGTAEDAETLLWRLRAGKAALEEGCMGEMTKRKNQPRAMDFRNAMTHFRRFSGLADCLGTKIRQWTRE